MSTSDRDEQGETTMGMLRLIQPLDWVPKADFVVIHKLMIEADEQTYLQKANRFVPKHASRSIE